MIPPGLHECRYDMNAIFCDPPGDIGARKRTRGCEYCMEFLKHLKDLLTKRINELHFELSNVPEGVLEEATTALWVERPILAAIMDIERQDVDQITVRLPDFTRLHILAPSHPANHGLPDVFALFFVDERYPDRCPTELVYETIRVVSDGTLDSGEIRHRLDEALPPEIADRALPLARRALYAHFDMEEPYLTSAT